MSTSVSPSANKAYGVATVCRLLWVQTFDTVEDLRRALLDFKRRYNSEWLIERHGFKPPAAVRDEQLTPMALAA
jgi:putative transposase